MGKGDKKTKRGKISMGSYGVKRPRKSDNNYKPDNSETAKAGAKSTSKSTK